ncbi:MAG: hypothetical protein ACREP9_17830, partial [Candidatus Dormibacteraceae bacterium]
SDLSCTAAEEWSRGVIEGFFIDIRRDTKVVTLFGTPTFLAGEMPVYGSAPFSTVFTCTAYGVNNP